MKKRYKTNYSIDECINRFTAFNEHEIEDSIKFVKRIYSSKVVLKVIKINNYFFSGIYKNAYRNIVCKFKNVGGTTEIEISTPIKIRHKIVYIGTLALFCIPTIINCFAENIGWNHNMIMEAIVLLFFSAACTLLFYFGVNLKRKTNGSILLQLISLFECTEINH